MRNQPMIQDGMDTLFIVARPLLLARDGIRRKVGSFGHGYGPDWRPRALRGKSGGEKAGLGKNGVGRRACVSQQAFMNLLYDAR
jgi:hypothetical protein